VPLKFPRCVAISLKSEVHPQIPKSRTVEAVNINKSVSQSEKAVPAGFWCRNRAVSIWLQKPAPVKIWRQMHARRYDTCSRIGVEFMTPVSEACVIGLRHRAFNRLASIQCVFSNCLEMIIVRLSWMLVICDLEAPPRWILPILPPSTWVFSYHNSVSTASWFPFDFCIIFVFHVCIPGWLLCLGIN